MRPLSAPRRRSRAPATGLPGGGGASGSVGEEILHVAAPFLILSAPFAGFLEAADYGWTRPEALVSIAVFIVLALLAGALSVNVGAWTRAALLLALSLAAADFLFPLGELWAALDLRIGGLAGREHGAGPVWTSAALLAGSLAALAALVALRGSALLLCALAFAALAAGLVSVGGLERDRAVVERAGPTPAASETLPPLVHIVLDGHNAPAALGGESGGAQLREILESMWTERGFRVFSRAFGQYDDSVDALAALMNRDLPALDGSHVGSDGRALTAAAHIDALAARGYAVEIHTDDRLDLCAGAAEPVALCVVHRARAAALAPLDLPTAAKFALLWRLYLERSDAWRALRGLWNAGAAAASERFGLGVSEWPPPLRLESLATPAMAERLAARLRDAGPGRAAIARLPAADAPWAWGADCALDRDPGGWLGPHDRTQPPPRRNDEPGRELRRKRSNAQLECAHRRLGALIDAIDENPALAGATVLVHGLHGSGIVGVPPTLEHERRAAAEDFVDGFSTFLALRAPGAAPGVDPRPTPLQTVFPTFFGAPPAASGAPILFLRGWSSRRLAARPAERLLGSFFRADAEPAPVNSNEGGYSP